MSRQKSRAAGKREELVRLESVTHRFPDGTAGIEEINLVIRRGDFLILAGRNGSGKTVLMKHLNGLLEPSEGRVLFGGSPVQSGLAEVRRKVGLVFQNPDTQIICHTVREEIAFGPENLLLSRKEIDERTARVLREMEMEHLAERNTATLSGGEKRKLTIAGIAVMEPEILALDEPFTGLDLDGVREALHQILRLHRSGTTILLITHELEHAAAYANRLAVMEGGRIAEDGTPKEIIDGIEQYGVKNPFKPEAVSEDLLWPD
jgi:biotin transport system ATP-binding protein